MRTTAMLLVLMLVSPVAASIGEGQNYDIDFEIDGENILPTSVSYTHLRAHETV